MPAKYLIQANEKMLIERDFGSLGTEITSVDGPLTKAEAMEEMLQFDNQIAAFRMEFNPPNVEDLTDDLAPVVIEHDPSIARHERSMSDTARFI